MTVKKGIFVILIMMWTSLLFAEPQVQSVVRKGNQDFVVINGGQFGDAPNVQIFDNFDHPDAEGGKKVDYKQAFDNHWMLKGDPTLSPRPLYDPLAYSGNYSALFYSYIDGIKQLHTHMKLKLREPAADAFVAYATRTKPATSYPGRNHYSTGNAADFPIGSSWKYTWLYDQDVKGNSSDICAVTYVGYGNVYLAGNDFNVATLPKIYNWWDKNDWNHISVHLNANEQFPTDAGAATVSIANQAFGHQLFAYEVPIFDNDGPEEKVFRNFTIPGWIRASDRTSAVVYDDIYLATGPNAAARVVFTNHSFYSLSNKVAIQRVMNWTDKQVVMFMDFTVFDEADDVYMHIFDGQGIAMNNGLNVNKLRLMIDNNNQFTRIYGQSY